MKIRNPNYVASAVAFVNTNKAAIQAYFVTNAAKEFVTCQDLQTAFPALASQLTDGMIAEIAARLGYTIEP